MVMCLLDTNFVINLQKRKSDELQFLLDNQVKFDECFVSVITKLEVLGFHGQIADEKVDMEKLIGNFRCFELDFVIQQKTIEIREQRKIKLPDSIILATALVKNKRLVTADVKLNSAYQFFKGN
ncbi:type II toxin-antitoxin system VapC family toxin [Moraxella bovis]|nr:type II toxin-antitoxin system VapC family toxin [Moraxella bovis]AWY21037.1 type II toxin-antitoxin system VapC family toxin [Moraxella bovis]UZA10993.1 type II toxin-antitoxin system VapC family toxin [Moraxella bovis]